MRNRKADIPTIGVEGIANYSKYRNELLNRHFVYTPDGNLFLMDNNSLVPHPLIEPELTLTKKGRIKGKNLDGRTNWME